MLDYVISQLSPELRESQYITSWVIIGFWYDITNYAAFWLTTIYWFSFNTAMFPDNGTHLFTFQPNEGTSTSCVSKLFFHESQIPNLD
jgi:purine-cytosine permease-like protein